jgi:ribulose 1,5-bisphosphate synthetase/thiazole synthase
MPVFSRLAVCAQLLIVLFSPALAAPSTQEYDYVIVGGGVSGLVVANRLTEDNKSTLSAIVEVLRSY